MVSRTPGLRALSPLALIFALFACASSPPPEPATPAPTEAEEPPHDDTATLNVDCLPPSEVRVDGKSIGKSPIVAHKVPPGPHDVTCVDERTGPSTMSVTLEPGEGRSVSLGSPPSTNTNEPPPPAKKK